MPAVRTRPGRRIFPAENVIDPDPGKTRYPYRQARADRTAERGLVSVKRLREHGPPATADAQKANGGTHVLLLVGRKVAHEATAVRPATPGKLGSMPSSCIA